MSRVLANLLFGILVGCFWPKAVAAETGKDKARAALLEGDDHLGQGDRLIEAGKVDEAIAVYEKALAAYQRAYKLHENPKIFFPIALAEQKLGRFLEALTHYNTVLQVDDLDPAISERVRNNIAESKANLGGLEFYVKPEGATVLVDGQRVGLAPINNVVYVMPGVHRVEVRTDKRDQQELVEVLPGKTHKVEIELDSVQRLSKRIRRKGASTEEQSLAGSLDNSGPSKTTLWISGGVTVALAATATGLGLAALSEQNRHNQLEVDDPGRQSAKDKAKALGLGADVAWLATATAASVTLYLYLTRIRDDDPSPKAALELVPVTGPDQVGLAVLGAIW